MDWGSHPLAQEVPYCLMISKNIELLTQEMWCHFWMARMTTIISFSSMDKDKWRSDDNFKRRVMECLRRKRLQALYKTSHGRERLQALYETSHSIGKGLEKSDKESTGVADNAAFNAINVVVAIGVHLSYESKVVNKFLIVTCKAKKSFRL